MEVRYRNDLYGNYLLIAIPETVDSDQYSFKMLEKNRISGVLSCKERREDGKGYWYVDVSKKRSLMQEYKEKEMQLEDMVEIFQQLIPILEELRTYLLSENMVILDPKYIFRDMEDHSLHIIILPWNTEEKTLQKLAEFFLEKINHRDEHGVNAAYLFYRQQNQQHFSLYHFLPVLEKESILKRQKGKEKSDRQWNETETAEKPIKEWKEQSPEEFMRDAFDHKESSKSGKEKQNGILPIIVLLFSAAFLILGFLPAVNSMISISCIAFSVLLFIVFFILLLTGKKNTDRIQTTQDKKDVTIREIDADMKETVFFDSFEDEECLKLQWKEKGRKKQFLLKEFPCIVGKIKDDTNLCISDISVSRIHCRFVEQDNKICIMDLNSTNGTFLNGLPLKSGEILEIEKNDEILIGKVKVNVV